MIRFLLCAMCCLVGISVCGEIPKPTDAPKPMSAAESAGAFELPAGFKMEVIASEPLVAQPTGVCWDERGRMFVSELHGYNLAGELDIRELNKTGKLDTQVRRVQAAEKFKRAAEARHKGVVKRLIDSDGDGRMDKAEVWADDLPPAYGLVPARGGVIVACAPDIVYLADRDGDGKAEVREVLFTGFETGELERGVNAPMWGDDGWIYFGRGWGSRKITGLRLKEAVSLPNTNFRIRADGSAIEPVPGSTWTFGLAITKSGDHFVTTTTSPAIYIAPFKWRYLSRNPNISSPRLEVYSGDRRAYSLASPHPWRKKRAEDPGYSKYYRDRYGASDSDAGGWFTSACGPFVYRDKMLPGLRGQYFVCEPAGSLIHRAEIYEESSALLVKRVAGELRSEFAGSKDSWSHPIHITHDPNGTMTVVDFYREIIEDYSAIPRHLQQQYGLMAGHDRGRIYRIVHEGTPKAPKADMADLDLESLSNECASAYYWRRQTAQRLLIEKQAKAATPRLRALLSKAGDDSDAIITLLRTLDGLGTIAAKDLRLFVGHGDEAVRIHALQLSDKWLKQDAGDGLLDSILAGLEKEKNPKVLIQFALSLGESEDKRSLDGLAKLAGEHLSIRWMDTAILSSVHGREAGLLEVLVKHPPKVKGFISSLAQVIAVRNNEQELANTFRLTKKLPNELQMLIIEGLIKGREVSKGKQLTSKDAITALAELAENEDVKIQTKAYLLQRTYEKVNKTYTKQYPKDFEIPATAVDEATFKKYLAGLKVKRDLKRGHEIYTAMCSICHQVGKEGKVFGPDLMGEIGVSEETLIRHILMPRDRIRPGYETSLVETRHGEGVLGIVINDGATSVTVLLPGEIEQDVLRKDIVRVRKVPGSLMPSFANVISPEDVAHLLAWLRSQGKTEDHGRVVLFDEDPGFAGLLTQENGLGRIVKGDAESGRFYLKITPPQRASNKIPGWEYSIVENPKGANEFRYMRLSWRAKGDGVMLELANGGRWPDPKSAGGRYYAGENTTAWSAKQVDVESPGKWTTVTFDLWKDMGAFKLTGLAPTAMGGEADFDRIELMKVK